MSFWNHNGCAVCSLNIKSQQFFQNQTILWHYIPESLFCECVFFIYITHQCLLKVLWCWYNQEVEEINYKLSNWKFNYKERLNKKERLNIILACTKNVDCFNGTYVDKA